MQRLNMWNRKPNGHREVASNVAGKRHSEREVHRVSAGFGQRAVDLAASVGRSKQDLMEAADISLSTLNRLLRGEGSTLAAIKMKRVLGSWGADVSKLPSVDADDDAAAVESGVMPIDEPLREGFELLKRLYQLASDERFRAHLDELAELVHAHELVVRGTGRVGPLKRP